MYTTFLNREILSKKELTKILKSVQNKKILKSKGGFLFKSSMKTSEFHLGIVPVIMDAERSHHYDIELDYEDQFVLSGFFNVDGTFGILFTPPETKDKISSNFKEELLTKYINTIKVLVEYGLSKEVKLDWISQKMLEEIGIFNPIPKTLNEILEYS